MAARPLWLLIAPLMLVLPLTASATLGETSTSIETDRTSMKASTRIAPATNYAVHALQAPSGTTVREYVSQDGMVFAVAWQGPFLPDLRQTLGRYFERYSNAVSAKRAGRRQVAVSESDFVVQSGGRMRAFSGRAYLPQLLPQGFTLEQLR
jgi:hypothetical protein